MTSVQIDEIGAWLPSPVLSNYKPAFKCLIQMGLLRTIEANFCAESIIDPVFPLLQGSRSQREGAARLRRFQRGGANQAPGQTPGDNTAGIGTEPIGGRRPTAPRNAFRPRSTVNSTGSSQAS